MSLILFLIMYVVLSFLSGLRTIWIVGDSYVRRGQRQAKETMGTNLGVSAHIQWFGRGGLCWDGLLPWFKQCMKGRTALDVLVIHCGGNDLGRVKSTELLKVMKKDLLTLYKQFPQMRILFSAINQRCHWRHAPPEKVDKARKFVNHVMASFVLAVNGRTVHHPHIVHDKPELFLNDNVHLSSQGYCLFLSAIGQALQDLEG